MALIPCPECGNSISDKAFSCPSCGYPVNPAIPSDSPPPKRRPRKHRKLPNGSGSIKHLSGRRSRPWAAYPPVKKFAMNGSPVLGSAIGYFKIYDEAYKALMFYNNAPDDLKNSDVPFADLCATLLSGCRHMASGKYADITFAELYELYFESKYNNPKRTFSAAAGYSAHAAFNNCRRLHDAKFIDLRKDDLQGVIDTCTLKHSSLELIVSLFKGMYSYAVQNDIVEKDYSRFVRINIPDDDENGVPFSSAALDILWKNSDMENVDIILLMIYTGFRISAYRTIYYNEAEQYFQGGVKTAAGKNRVVPLHPAIQTFAKSFIKKYSSVGMTFAVNKFRNSFYKTLDLLGLSMSDCGTKHTPHDCRHTFSWLCDKYGVDDLSKHLLMGHAVRTDVSKSVYGHRTFEELKNEIGKIIVPCC